MFILAFSLDWFTTIPGILMSLGVVLLIVAIILFATGNKKDKTKVAASNVQVENSANVQAENNVIPVEPVAAVEVQPVTDNVQIEEQPKFEDIPMGTPGVDPINSVVPELNLEIAEVPTEIKIEEPVSIDEVSVEQPEVSVYGGANPVDSLQAVAVEEPKAPTIYGGNDPLEATQSLPKIEEHHEPYGGAINEVKIVEPVAEPVIEMPEVEPIQVETPTIEETPISFEIPVTPIEVVSESIEIPTVIPEVVAEPTIQPVVEPIVAPVVEEPVQEKSTIEEL